MADYFTTMSAMLYVKDGEQRKWLEKYLPLLDHNEDIGQAAHEKNVILEALKREAEELDCYSSWGIIAEAIDQEITGPEWTIDPDAMHVWFRTETESLEAMADLVRIFLCKFDEKPWSFEWANTCSKLRTDGFGGGAGFVTKDKVEFFTTNHWIEDKIEELTKELKDA
jgi:hypothetical protein